MRVVSGKIRGLKLYAPDGEDTRPTLDRVKEAVFSMLTPYINDSIVLDAFAGSGALGIEALSRGASFCVFADSDTKAINCIYKNLQNGKISDYSFVYFGDVLKYIRNCDKKFDIVFLDPPYASNMYKKILEEISVNNILSDDGLIVTEWDFSSKPDFGDFFEILKEKKYGRVGVSVLKRGSV